MPMNFNGITMSGGMNFIGSTAPASDPYFYYTSLLLPGNGSNGAQNNTFLDGSTNNFTITRNGNTTQGTFSPFSQTGWSNYFDGTGDYLTVSNSIALSGDFTIEGWFNLQSAQSSYRMLTGQSVSSSGTYAGITSSGIEIQFGGSSSTLVTCTFSFTTNIWYHIAIVRSGSTVAIYINGSAQSVTQSTQSGTFTAQYVGVGYSSSYPFHGYISNFRILSGTALYTSTFTPPTSPLTAITNTSLLTCQSNRFLDNSTNNFTITKAGDTSVQAFSPFNPTAAWSAATYGGSGYFDGSGDDLTTPSNAAFTYGTGDFCVEGWFYFTGGVGGSGYSYAFAQGASTGSSSLGLYIQSGVYKVWNGSDVITGTASFVQNTWVHLAVTRSGTTMRLFVNGVQDGSATNSSNITTGTTTGISIGRWSEIGDTNYITGYVSGFRAVKGTAVYTAAFTPPTAPLTAITNTSLLLNFTNGTIYDATSKNDLETVGTAQISTTQSKYGGSSIYLNGDGNYLISPASNLYSLGSGDFTIEMWLYMSSSSSNQCIIDFRRGSDTNGLFLKTTSATNYEVRIGGSSVHLFTATASQFNHIAIVRASGTIKTYVNGTEVGSTSNSTNLTSTGPLNINRFYDSALGIVGYIDDLRVTKGYARYTTNFTPSTTAFPLQ